MNGQILKSLAVLIGLASLGTAHALEVTVSPSRFVLGTDKRALFSVKAPTPPGAHAGAGELSAPVLERDGSYRVEWRPPATRAPMKAVLVFWTAAPEGKPDVTGIALPLVGRTDLEIETEPLTEVRVQVGEEVFGPRQADAQGRVRVPIHVPPSERTAVVHAQAGGQATKRKVALNVPDVPALTAAVFPSPLPREGGWLVVADSVPLDPSKLNVDVIGGAAKLVHGRYSPERGAGVALYRLSVEADRLSVAVSKNGAPLRIEVRAEVIPAKPPPTIEPPKAPGPLPAPRLSVSSAFGGFYARGSNIGPLATLTLGYTLEGGLLSRLTPELSAGMRSLGQRRSVATLGAAFSDVLAVPLDLCLRGEVLRVGQLSFSARGCGGVTIFRHALRSDFQRPFVESAVGGRAVFAGQVAYVIGRLHLFADVGGGYSPLTGRVLRAHADGLFAGVGARYLVR